MAVGTGYPLKPEVGHAVAQPQTVLDGDKLTNAQDWQRIAQAGATIAEGAAKSMAYDAHQQQVGWYAEQDNIVRRQRAEMRDKFDGDPQGFDAAWKGYTAGKLGETPRWAQNHMKSLLGSEGNAAYSGLLSQKRTKDHSQAVDSWKILTDNADRDVVAASMAGTLKPTDSEGLHTDPRIIKYQGVLQSGVTSGFISQERADAALADITDRTIATTVVREIGDEYKAARANGEVASRRAMEIAEERILRNPDLRLDEQKRYAYYSKAAGEVRALEAERKQDLALARQASNDLKLGLAAGVMPDQQVLGGLVDQLNAAGGQKDAADLLGAVERAKVMGTFGTRSLQDQMRIYKGVTGQNEGVGILANRLAHRNVRVDGVNPDFSGRLSQAITDAEAATGAKAQINSLHRTNEEQVEAYKRFLGGKISLAAPPGTSRHEFGEAADIQPGPVLDWLHKNAERYGLEFLKGSAFSRDPVHIQLSRSGGAAPAGSQPPPAAGQTAAPSAAPASAAAPTYTPGTDYRLIASMQGSLAKQARADWAILDKDFDNGIRPPATALQTTMEAAAVGGDHMLLEKMARRIAQYDAKEAAGLTSVPQQQANITALEREGALGRLEPGYGAIKKDLESMMAATIKGLEDEPVSHTVGAYPERFGAPKALNPSDSKTFRDGLAYRAQVAKFAEQSWQTGKALSAIDKNDMGPVKAILESGSYTDKARVYADMAASLPPDVYDATIRKLGGDNFQQLVGRLAIQQPDLARNVLFGKDMMKTKEVSDKASLVRPALEQKLGGQIYPSVAEQSAVVEAALSLYTARRGTAGALYSTTDTAGIEKAIEDITGPIVRRNGQQLPIAPGIPRGAFIAALDGLTNAELALDGGALGRDGRPIDAAFIGRNAVLKPTAVGSPMYIVGLPDPTAIDNFSVILNGEGFPLVFDMARMAGKRPAIGPATPYQERRAIIRSEAAERIRRDREAAEQGGP